MTKSHEMAKIYMAHCQDKSRFDCTDLTVMAMLPLYALAWRLHYRWIANQILLLPRQHRIDIVSGRKATGLIIAIWVWTWKLPRCPATRAAEHARAATGLFALSLQQICMWSVGSCQHPGTGWAAMPSYLKGWSKVSYEKHWLQWDCCGLRAALFWWRCHS